MSKLLTVWAFLGAFLCVACTGGSPMGLARRINADSTIVVPDGFERFSIVDKTQCSALFNGADTLIAGGGHQARLLLLACFDQEGPDTLRSYARMALYDIRDRERPKFAAGVVVSRPKSNLGAPYEQQCHVAWFAKNLPRGATPPPPYPSVFFSVGEWIEATASIDVREKPDSTAPLTGVQALGAKGKVVGGPVYVGGRTWWQIDYKTGIDGWSVAGSMVKAFVSAYPQSDKFEVDEQGSCARINSRLSVLVHHVLK